MNFQQIRLKNGDGVGKWGGMGWLGVAGGAGRDIHFPLLCYHQIIILYFGNGLIPTLNTIKILISPESVCILHVYKGGEAGNNRISSAPLGPTISIYYLFKQKLTESSIRDSLRSPGTRN